MGNTDKKTGRIGWIDCAKGIAICLVVIGHTVARTGDCCPDNLVRGVIFSFHMPLFFVFSGMIMKLSQSREELLKRMEKSAWKLLAPAVVLFLALRMYSLLLYGRGEGVSKHQYLADTINALIYSSGVDVMNLQIPAIGGLWFLVALFFGKSIFDYLHFRLNNSTFVIVCIGLSIIGVGLGSIQWLPFSGDISLAVLAFFLFGYWMRDLDISRHSIRRAAAALLIWASLLSVIFWVSRHYLEFATREYPLFPLPFFCAAAGVLLVSYFAYYLGEIPGLSEALLFLGRNTMIIYCVHAADGVLSGIWLVSENNFINAFLRLAVVLAVSCGIIGGMTIIKRWRGRRV